MRRRTLLAAGAAGLSAATTGRPASAAARDRQPAVALVPLDDRPVELPWDRLFEVTLEPRLRLS